MKKEIKLFIIVMIIFTIGMAFLLFYEVSDWWIWYIFFAIWTLIELKIAKNIKLKWWHWAIIIGVILSIDWFVLELIDCLKK
jgi:Ni,Fe-hydrogenase I cytochrome b subunit